MAPNNRLLLSRKKRIEVGGPRAWSEVRSIGLTRPDWRPPYRVSRPRRPSQTGHGRIGTGSPQSSVGPSAMAFAVRPAEPRARQAPHQLRAAEPRSQPRRTLYGPYQQETATPRWGGRSRNSLSCKQVTRLGLEPRTY